MKLTSVTLDVLVGEAITRRARESQASTAVSEKEVTSDDRVGEK